jgi:endonuclease YncB( thermonuclease family)
MAYRLIEGEVRLFYRTTRLVGSRPDGDSAWFKPNNPKLLQDIGQRDAKLNKGGFAQLRFEGIDALELHFPGSAHQSKNEAVAARDFLLEKLGFPVKDIEFAPNDDIPTTVRNSNPVIVKAHILTRAIDPFGRPVAFVYPGTAPEPSGSDIWLDVPRLNRSLNAKLIAQGQAYPAFYSAREINGQRIGGLPGPLRERLASLAIDSFNAGRGLWPVDETHDNPKIGNIQELQTLAIWPKLYRRLAKFFSDGTANHNGMQGFIDWLHADLSGRDDRLWITTIGEMLNFSDILSVSGKRISMDHFPEDIIIVPR